MRKPIKQHFQISCFYGNIVNFSHMSRIHFSANSTSFCPFKRMGTQMPKNPRNSPFPFSHVDPHLIHQCLVPPYSPRRVTAQSVHALPHNYATKDHWLQRDTSNSPTKLPLPIRRLPPPSNTPIPWSTPLTTPNGMWIQSAISPQYTLRTDRPTDRWSRRMFCSAPLAMLIESDVLKSTCESSSECFLVASSKRDSSCSNVYYTVFVANMILPIKLIFLKLSELGLQLNILFHAHYHTHCTLFAYITLSSHKWQIMFSQITTLCANFLMIVVTMTTASTVYNQYFYLDFAVSMLFLLYGRIP